MANRELIFGAADDAATRYKTRDSDPTGGGNYQVVELDGGETLLLERAATGGWTIYEPVDLNGSDLTTTGTVDAGQVSNDNYVEPQPTASEGTSYSVDLSAGNYHKVTLTGDVTFDFTNVDASETNSFVLHLVQDGTGSRTPSFTPTVVWPDGSAPSWSTAANAEDVVTFVHDQDGSQWLGFLGGLAFA
jgi:hypothetical protein